MELLKSQKEAIEKQKAIRKIQSIALKSVHDFFFEEEFEQLMPVILSPITDPLGPDPGSSVIKTGEIEYLGQRLQLTQSMILHKQIAIGMGIEKLYIISPNVRLEDPKKSATGVHAFEFSQIDFEIKGASSEEIFELVERLLRRVVADVKRLAKSELELLDRTIQDWEERFPVYSTHNLEKLYGEDWEIESSKTETSPYFVVCHKREFYDKRDRSKEGEHYLNYDLYYPEGFLEALSGAERESEAEFVVKRILDDGFSLEQYKGYVERAKKGALQPSAGGGIGVERLIRYLVGADHIGDIQLFPRIPGKPVDI